jgi:nitroreductase
MDILKVIRDRKSTRGFLDKPVERKTLERLLSLATRAPSAINLQPWEFVVVSGEERKRLSRFLVKGMREKNISCGPDARDPLPKRFIARQKGLLDCMLSGIPDGLHFQEFINEGSCNFYGAPTAVIINIDHLFSSSHLTDIGIVVGYFVLAAHALGLGSCPIGLITAFGDDIRELLNLPDGKKVIISIAVGYIDPDAKINQVRSERVPLADVVRWFE